MIINNFAILYFGYNYIDKNNTDPLNTRGRNNCNIIISNHNSRNI